MSPRSVTTTIAAVVSTCAMSLGLVVAIGCSGEHTEAGSPDAAAARDSSVATDEEMPALDATSTCPPQPDGGVTPRWAPPVPFHQGFCQPGFASAVMGCLFTPGYDAQLCNHIQDAAPDACRACLMTAVGAAPSGATILDDGYARLNVAGCLWNLTNAGTQNDCIIPWAAREDCAVAACTGCRARGVAIHDGCVTEARRGVCANPALGECAEKLLFQGLPGEVCNPSSDFLVTAGRYGELFCGVDPSDAGDAASE